MACGKTGQPTSHRLTSTTTADQFQAVSGWMLAPGLDSVKMVIKRKSVQVGGVAPTFSVKPAIQVATVRPDNAGDWAVIAGFGPWTGAGEVNTGLMNVAGTTGGQMFVRFGVAYALGGTAPTTGQADVEVQLSFVACGTLVGSMTQDLQAFNTTTNSTVAITGWVSTIEAEKVIASFVLSGVINNFRCQLAVRYATTNIQTPGAWSSLEGSTYRDSNGETTTAALTVNGAAEMFVQFGVSFSQSTAGQAPGQATVTTSIAVRRA